MPRPISRPSESETLEFGAGAGDEEMWQEYGLFNNNNKKNCFFKDMFEV